MVEASKHEIRKYLKRERRKTLPKDVDYWDFDCRFGDTEAEARVVHLSEIDTCIQTIEQRELTSFYVEILIKPGVRKKAEKPVDDETPTV